MTSSQEDGGTFVARRPDSADVVVLRPTAAGLRFERPGREELVAWGEVTEVDVLVLLPRTRRSACVRIRFRDETSFDMADGSATGRDPEPDLPVRLDGGSDVLHTGDRVRLLAATVISCASLAPHARDAFRRGGRAVPAAEPVPRPRRLPRWAPPALLAASIVTLYLLLPDATWGGVLAIMAAVLVHEGGHAIALRWAGMGVRRILFLPALGAATMPERGYRTRWDDAWVALAGPCTGLPVAAAALLLWDTQPPDSVRWGIFVAVALGLLNLAPFVPLDGGRVVMALVAGLPRRVRVLLVSLPFLVLFAALRPLGVQQPSLGVTLLIVFLIAMTHVALRRQQAQDWMLRLGVPTTAVRAALHDVTLAADGAASDHADGGVPPQPLTRRQAAVVVAGYALFVVALAAAASALAGIVPEMQFVPGIGAPR